MLDWCHDDRPVALKTRAGPLLSVPYPQEANDANAIVVRRMTAEAFADLIVDQFDEMLEQAKGPALVCPVSLHPHVSGQPHRLRQLRRAFSHIAGHRARIWAARAGDIADVAIGGYGIAWTLLVCHGPAIIDRQSRAPGVRTDGASGKGPAQWHGVCLS